MYALVLPFAAVAIAAAALAAPVFALSVAYAAHVNRDAGIDDFNKTLLTEFSEIVEMTRGKRVLVASPPKSGTSTVLAFSRIR